MSYRELRDFTEHMKTLGYPSALSIDSFRQPNFPLVASLLLFLLHRYDPTLVPPEDISSQAQRVSFIQAVTAMLLSKCHIKLSMKQLYKADGYAVKELLKLSTTLYTAMSASTTSASATASSAASASADASAALTSFDSFRDAKALSADLIDLGERLSSLLSNESAVRPAREQALLFVDSISGDDPRGQAVERSIRRQMALMADNVKELRANHGNVVEDCDKVRAKLERREGERERVEKRWKALRRVKPQFLEEYEREEKELRAVYANYVERLRNVHWLEGEMAQLRREEEEEKRESERRLASMQKRLREEERKILRGQERASDEEDDEDDEDEEEEEEDEDDGGDGREDDHKRGYERKDRRGEEDEDDEEEGEEDQDEGDLEDEEKRPNRRGASGRADRPVVRGRSSVNTGRVKGRSGDSEDVGTGSETSGLGDGDDYF